MTLNLIMISLLAYLIGSIPFGLILTKVFLKQDVRDIGSGNTGATNVLRTGSKKLALLTLILDAFKGMFVIFFLSSFLPPFPGHTLFCGLLVILGHCFPVWLKFKGGKGVATALGVLLAAIPVSGLVMCLTWLISFLATRISSLAAISAMVIAPAVTYGVYGLEAALWTSAISALVIARHHSNIKRLMKGEEKPFKSS